MNTQQLSATTVARLFPRSMHALGMTFEKPDGLDWLDKQDIQNFLTKKRPQHQWDPLLVNGLAMKPVVDIYEPPVSIEPKQSYQPHIAGKDGYLSIPHVALYPDVVPPQDEAPLECETVGTWDAQHLMEEYLKMKDQVGHTTVEASLGEVVQLEDERAHQLIETPDPVQQATILLRLLEEDVYMLERLGRTDMAGVASDLMANGDTFMTTPLTRTKHDVQRIMAEERVTYVEAVYGNALNALVHISHCKLVKTLHAVREADRVSDLQAALTRMDYTHWVDDATGQVHLRNKTHNKYGAVIF
jgi:hypothetical protein